MKVIAGIFAVILILALIVWYNVFRYGDCKRVGHSTLYCVLDIGR